MRTEKDGIITFECDKDRFGNEILNSSQRNNELVWPTVKDYPKAQYRTSWRNMCNVTSYAMALEYAGWIFPKGQFKQPEDNLGLFILTDKSIRDKMKKSAPILYDLWMRSLEGKCTERELKSMYFPTELHDYLSFGANQWLGKDVSEFKTESSFKTVLWNNMVYNNLPLVISTIFGGFGHIVCCSGVQYNKEDFKNKTVIPSPISIIIDDPWGKYNPKTDKYDLPNGGNDIIIPWNIVVQRVKPAGNEKKWVHTFKRGIATV